MLGERKLIPTFLTTRLVLNKIKVQHVHLSKDRNNSCVMCVLDEQAVKSRTNRTAVRQRFINKMQLNRCKLDLVEYTLYPG